mgnify:CR=1 FL=1
MREHIYTFETVNADGVVDSKEGVIHGVSMITGGLTAKGHGLEVDNTTLKQIHACAKKMGKVPVKTNHGSGVDSVNGFLDGFRIDGDKVRGDWTLLQSYQNTAHLLEMAEKMPSSVGLSVAFRGDPETIDGAKVYFDEKTKAPYTLNAGGGRVNLAAGEKIYARCEELVSTDLVASPAANPDGMFSARVDKENNGMAKTNSLTPPAAEAAPQAEPTLADVMKMLQGINSRLDAVENGAGGDEDELTDEQIEALLEDGTLVEDEDGNLVLAEEAGEGEGEGGEAGEGEGAEAAEHAGAAEAALSRNDPIHYFEARINQLEAQINGEKQAKQNAAKRTAENALAAKVQQLTQFAEEVRLQNEALHQLNQELSAKVPARVSSGGESILFDAKPTGTINFQSVLAAKMNLFANNTSMTKFDKQAAAMKAAIEERPDLYTAFQAQQGIIRL